MKQLYQFFIVLSILFLYALDGKSQCIEFAEDTGISLLDTANYIQTGRYNTIEMSEGEDISLFKTFYSGQKYRLVICGAETLPDIDFNVADFRRTPIFSNDNNEERWDFELKTSQRLVISVIIPDSNSSKPKKGCIAIIFGVEKEKKKERK